MIHIGVLQVAGILVLSFVSGYLWGMGKALGFNDRRKK